jgi:PKD repeat protein
MKTIIKKFLLFYMISNACNFSAQIEFSKWCFGQLAGLDFSSSPPSVFNSYSGTPEGVASICDNAGNLLFYGDGTSIITVSNTIMANGSGLTGHPSSTQSSLIVKQPGSNNLYYNFTTTAIGAPDGLRYSIVDMSLAAGMGSVTVKNVPLYTPTCEKQVAVRHCNGRDIWIVTHDFNSNQFRSFLLNSAGLSNSPVLSAVGGTIGGAGGFPAPGYLKVSPDGRKLAMASYTNSIPANLGVGGFFMFDFDPASGMVSNSLTLLSAQNLPINAGPYGVEFSPDGTKLYGTTSPNGNQINSSLLFQWDLCAGNNGAVISSQYSININSIRFGSIQKAIDNKLYIVANATQSLSVINNPNASGAGMNFVLNGLSIAPNTGFSGLPNFINPYTKTPPANFTNSVACQTASFFAPPNPTYNSGCSPTSYAPNSYLWDFGEAAAGAGNNSTASNPVHTYSALGTYTVSLILYSNCNNDTLKKVISISIPSPTVSVSGTFEICKGEKRVYTASGANTYVWSNNSTSVSTTFSPATTTVYSVTGTATTGCKSTKVFTVNVKPCVGIVTNEKNIDLRLYPNPVKDVLSIECAEPANVVIYDMNGLVILESKVNPGVNEINTSNLKPGVYYIRSSNTMGSWRGRLVKME